MALKHMERDGYMMKSAMITRFAVDGAPLPPLQVSRDHTVPATAVYTVPYFDRAILYSSTWYMVINNECLLEPLDACLL